MTTEHSILDHYKQTLRPDPSRTVVRPFSPDYPQAFVVKDHPRAQVIVDRILSLGDAELMAEMRGITRSLDERHRDVDELLLRRFDSLAGELKGVGELDESRRKLIGAYFSQEYSFEAAALFNPSVVLHPEQYDVPEGGVRFVMSLRGIGEGHISSVTFRTGTWVPGGELVIDPPSAAAVSPIVDESHDDGTSAVHLQCGGSRTVSETVLYPMLPSQRQGIEDVRLCRFVDDDGTVTYYGTFTAFSGAAARSEMLSGTDFHDFDMCALKGSASGGKGMALFPRKIGGRYAMLGRQDGENVWLHWSDDIYTWNGGDKLLEPHAPWEFVLMGNCGSPIEIDEGWLVLTHGVGTVRNYSMGAALLDKDDPSKVLGRTYEPILEPSPDERDGYVPNVVYSCGGLVHDRMLLLPYAVADSFTAFSQVKVDTLLAAMS